MINRKIFSKNPQKCTDFKTQSVILSLKPKRKVVNFMKIIGEHLTNFQYSTGKKPKEFCDAMNISKSNYYKIREDGTSSIEFVLDFANKYNYDLVNGLPLHQNCSCLIFGEGRQNLNAARRALGKSGNFILFDTSCRLLDEFGTILETRGYEIKILNLCDLQKSNTYNPFDYLKTEPEIYQYSEFLIKAILRKDTLNPMEYELCLALNSVLLFIMKKCPPFKRNFNSLFEILFNKDSKYSDINLLSKKSALGLKRLFYQLSYAEFLNLTATNNLCFEELFDDENRKIALFLINNPTHKFDWLIESLVYQFTRMTNLEPENQVTLICPSERIKNVIDNAFINDTERYQIKQHVDTQIK